jgi:hypothetical protein
MSSALMVDQAVWNYGLDKTNTLRRNITKITPTQKQRFGLEKIENENHFNLLLKVKTNPLSF